MAAEKSFDCGMKKRKYSVIRQFSYDVSEETSSEKGVSLAVESCSKFKGKQHFRCVESQQLKKTDVNVVDFQKPENEDIVDLESREFNKLQLLRNAMMMDRNVIVGDDNTSSLKMKLIDETAVISIILPGHQKKAKRPRRKGKGIANKGTSYSREELVAMRFIGVVKQKRLWRHIYQALGSVAQEYATLVAINNPNPPPPILLGPIAGSGRPNSLNIPVHPNIITPFYAQNWPYISQGSCPASSTK